MEGGSFISLIKEQAAIGCKRVLLISLRGKKAMAMCGALYYPGGRSRLVASVTGFC